MVARTATLALALFGGAEALRIGAAPMRSASRTCTIEMAKKSVGDLTKADLEGKRVLVRCDLNVPLDGCALHRPERPCRPQCIRTVAPRRARCAPGVLDEQHPWLMHVPSSSRRCRLPPRSKTITDDTRIRASIPTVKYLIDNGAKVLLSSHLGRPKGGPEDKFSLGPVAPRLSELLGKEVTMAPDCIGDAGENRRARTPRRLTVHWRDLPFALSSALSRTPRRPPFPSQSRPLQSRRVCTPPPPPRLPLNPPSCSDALLPPSPAVAECVAKMSNGDVLLLENTRFYKEEEKNDPEFAEKLAANADMFVNDAFGTAHRAHGSTEGVTKFLSPSVAGFLLQKELDYLDGAVSDPKRPFAAIVGGSKVSSKIGVIESLMEKVDKIVIGGGMVFTFLKARLPPLKPHPPYPRASRP
jgi:hypothetical protein